MSGANDFVGKVHAVNNGVFAFGWTMLFLVSGRLLSGVLPVWWIVVGALAAVLLGFIGLHPGERYFLVGAPERWVRTCRSGGIVLLRSWVIQGDRMNALLRARFLDYRVIRIGAVEAYILRTHDMERIHFACLLASVVVIALAFLGSLWALAWSLLAATFVTNILPIVLQRFNRARCQLVLRRRQAVRPSRTDCG